MPAPDSLSVAFLIGKDNESTRLTIAAVCELSGVRPVAVLIDTDSPAVRHRWRNLRRNVRREGVSYVFHRAIAGLRERLDRWADQVISQREVEAVLLKAFPERGLDQLARKYGFAVFETGNLNGALAAERLRSCSVDLGLVLGTRILKPSLFEIPRLGCLNLHKGRVPEYRGMPPGFWELYDGRDSAAVTVHFVDRGLDTGDVAGTEDVPIHPQETPESLRAKLDRAGAALLASVVAQLRDGTLVRVAQPPSSHKAKTRPALAQQQELARRLPHWRRTSDIRRSLKTALFLFIFYSGLYSLRRALARGRSRGAILLYHRVNDLSDDVLTTSTRRFAEHLVALRRHYRVLPTNEIVDCLARRKSIEPTAVAIHFDDCYRDVRTYAAPLLAAAGLSGTVFVASGFVDTSRPFQHDLDRYPHTFSNLTAAELRELPRFGVDVGGHTVNHVDLGTIGREQARVEVFECRTELEVLTERPVDLFSFPFGRFDNMREEVRQMVVEAGYKALFSAYGGFIGENTSLFDVPRIGVSSDHSALALLMELEGISFDSLKRWARSLRHPHLSATEAS